MSPTSESNSRHFRRLGVIVLLLLTNCMIDRGASRVRLSADGDYAHTGDRNYGCNDKPGEEQIQHQFGGSAGVRYEYRRGFNAQLKVGFLEGELDSYKNITPGRMDYRLWTVGGLLGYDFKHFGLDGIMTGVINVNGEGLILPSFIARAGNLTKWWIELTGGPMLDTPFDGRIFSVGIQVLNPIVSYNLGFGLLTHPIVDLGSCSDGRCDAELGSLGKTVDPSIYAILNIQVFGGLGVTIGGFLADSYSLRLGLTFDLWTARRGLK